METQSIDRTALATHGTRRLLRLASLLTVTALACAGLPDGDDLSTSPIGDGFFFQRNLQPGQLTLDGQAFGGAFNPTTYAAYTFAGQQGSEVDILTWADWSWWDYGEALGRAARGLTNVLFVWAPVNDSVDAADGRNWALLRRDSNSRGLGDEGHADFGFTVGQWERTRMILPATTQYMLLVLTTERSYNDGWAYHVSAKQYATPYYDTRPGNLYLNVVYSVSKQPVPGVRVAVGSQVVYTNGAGKAAFENLPPNEYSVKLGPNGYDLLTTVVRPGESRDQPVWLNVPY